ncbi:MAG: hypothetical protein KF773_02935 [Deltaproteobacteria bacterium]|nr:hypothetical protein [Deltaproteobacteria bacterium]
MAKAKSKPKVNAAALAAKMMGGGGSSPAIKKAAPAAAPAKAAAPAPAAVKPKTPAKLKANGAGDSGAAEAAAFAQARGLSTGGKARWWLDVALDVVDGPAPDAHAADATRFHLDIYRDEWSVQFLHKGKRSHIRKTSDVTFASGFDDYKLAGELPALDDIGALLRTLEDRHKIAFKREHAATRSNLAGAPAALRAWVAKL